MFASAIFEFISPFFNHLSDRCDWPLIKQIFRNKTHKLKPRKLKSKTLGN